MAIGIHKQVIEAAGGDINPVALGRFMRWWVRCPDYLDAVAHVRSPLSTPAPVAGDFP